MKKSDLIENIYSNNSNFYCIVGQNSSGKSYFLDSLFGRIENALYFHENGDVTITDNRSKVRIFNGQYIYYEDKNRGKIRTVDKSKEDIEENAFSIINYILELRKSIDIIHVSLGTKKLVRILDSFLSYNLNTIKYVLMDEPENSLDDKNLKTIASLINTLTKNNYTVITVTHSPRLLEIMKVDIDNIFIFQKPFDEEIRHLRFQDVIDKFDAIGREIDEFSKKQNIQIKRAEMLSFLPNTKLRYYYLLTLLHSIEFYKTLFYLDIFIVEGLTELYLVRTIQSKLPFTNNYFVSGGKYKIPFLIELFSSLCGTVHCFFDTDFKSGSITFASIFTGFITTKYGDSGLVNLYHVPGDIEEYLKIDKNSLIADLSNQEVSGEFANSFIVRYKEFLCLSLILANKDAREKIIKLFKNPKSYTQFDSFD